MTKILLVGLGGVIGAVSRYLLGDWVARISGDHWFPFGTLVINVTGCLAIGFLAGLADSRGLFSSEARVFMLIGIIGSFTTFSTFGYESIELMRGGLFFAAVLNIVLQVVIGLGAVWAGGVLARSL